MTNLAPALVCISVISHSVLFSFLPDFLALGEILCEAAAVFSTQSLVHTPRWDLFKIRLGCSIGFLSWVQNTEDLLESWSYVQPICKVQFEFELPALHYFVTNERVQCIGTVMEECVFWGRAVRTVHKVINWVQEIVTAGFHRTFVSRWTCGRWARSRTRAALGCATTYNNNITLLVYTPVFFVRSDWLLGTIHWFVKINK